MHFKKIIFTTSVLILSFCAPAHAQNAPKVGAKFVALSRKLGYTKDKNYFGATDDQVQALASYTDAEDPIYEEINSYLRFYPKHYEWTGTSPAEAKKIVKQLDGLFEHVPSLPTDLIVFRGLTLGFHQNKSFAIGEEFLDKAYVSTTTSYQVAKEFSTNDAEDPATRHALFVMYFDQATVKGILIGENYEDEVLLNHGQHFKVMDRLIHGKNDQYLIQICDQTKDCSASVRDGSLLKNWSTLR